MTPAVVNYVPPPIWAAVLVVSRDARAPSTTLADHLVQSSAERRHCPPCPSLAAAIARVNRYVD